MAIIPTRLKNVITGSKQKYFEYEILDDAGNAISSDVYIANIEENDSVLPAFDELDENALDSAVTNKYNMFINRTAGHKPIVIKNMFSILEGNDSNFDIRSYAQANSEDITNSVDAYSDTYINKSFDPKSIAYYNDSLMILTDKLSSAVYYNFKYIDILSYNHYIEYNEIVENPVYTSIFPSSTKLKEAVENGNFEEVYVPTLFVQGIPYNHVLQFPTSLYPMFKEDTLLGAPIICKNHLGYDYAMHSEAIENKDKKTEDDGDFIRKFNEFRTYKRLITCADQLYMVYTNDTKAETVGYNAPDVGKTNIVEGSITSSEPTETITNFDLSAAGIYGNYQTGKIEKVERLGNINRAQNPNRHKSNLYSIDISNLGLNELETSSDTVAIRNSIANIKKTIKNNITTICKKYQPGNAQLFSVFFTGN